MHCVCVCVCMWSSCTNPAARLLLKISHTNPLTKIKSLSSSSSPSFSSTIIHLEIFFSRVSTLLHCSLLRRLAFKPHSRQRRAQTTPQHRHTETSNSPSPIESFSRQKPSVFERRRIRNLICAHIVKSLSHSPRLSCPEALCLICTARTFVSSGLASSCHWLAFLQLIFPSTWTDSYARTPHRR